MRLIDADALREELKTPVLMDNEKASRIWEGWHECTIAVEEAIDRTPTIEERKTGKWIIEPYDAQNDIFIHRCGTCMRVTMLGGHTTRFKFCPNCGASMTEGESS